MGACINIKTREKVTPNNLPKKKQSKKQEEFIALMKAKCNNCPCKKAADSQLKKAFRFFNKCDSYIEQTPKELS